MPSTPEPGDGWHDLAHPVSARTPRVPGFPAPVVTRSMSLPADPMSVTDLHLCCHVGTHIDAPCHFVAGAATLDELHIDAFCGDGIVLDATGAQPRPFGVDDLLAAGGEEVRRGDIVLLATGWDAHVGTVRYDLHPSLSEEAAHWMVERRVKLVGLDVPTPDLPVTQRADGFTWPVHKILLGAGVLVAEHLRGLRALAGRRVEVVMAPLNIADGDGAPVRALARTVDA